MKSDSHRRQKRLGRPPGTASAPDRQPQFHLERKPNPTESEKIRKYGIEAWHSYWGSIPHEERVRRIEAAYAEVDEPVPPTALMPWEERRAGRD